MHVALALVVVRHRRQQTDVGPRARSLIPARPRLRLALRGGGGEPAGVEPSVHVQAASIVPRNLPPPHPINTFPSESNHPCSAAARSKSNVRG